MIVNDHGDNDKTPSSSGSQHIMLHVIYSTRGLPRTFWKMTFFKTWKNVKAGHRLMNWPYMLPTPLRPMGHGVEPANVSPLVVTSGNAPKAATILRYFKLENR